MSQSDIIELLEHFVKTNCVPNILLHGPPCQGKKTIIYRLLHMIYGDDSSEYTMTINCANGKGINFVREELKQFAKTTVPRDKFKSVILLMGDKLTMDAQSALRRCIEVYNHNTRFFISMTDRMRLIKPLQSRFCNIYVPSLTIERKKSELSNEIDECISSISKESTFADAIKVAANLYDRGISGIDMLEYMQYEGLCPIVLTYLHNMRVYMRCEEMCLSIIIYFGYIRLTAVPEYIYAQ